jgi:hypothetical protein
MGAQHLPYTDMQKLLTFCFLICSLSAFSQTTYRIDAVVGGGYYLVEITPSKEANTPPLETPQRFESKEILTRYVAALRKKAFQEHEEAASIEATAEKIEAIGNDFFKDQTVKKQ